MIMMMARTDLKTYLGRSDDDPETLLLLAQVMVKRLLVSISDAKLFLVKNVKTCVIECFLPQFWILRQFLLMYSMFEICRPPSRSKYQARRRIRTEQHQNRKQYFNLSEQAFTPVARHCFPNTTDISWGPFSGAFECWRLCRGPSN